MLNNSRRGVQVKGSRSTDATSDSSLLLDSLRNEVSVLSRKLGSKTEALSIMARELEQCRLDRDQFRAMLEQLRGSHRAGGGTWSAAASDAGLRHQLALSRQQCTELRQTVSDLTLKMEEVCGDMMVLRRDAVRQRCPAGGDSSDSPAENREDMVQKMEQMQEQCDQLRRDLELVLDEKEELVTQRDAYKGKTHRLNHQLKMALRAPAGSTLDVDSLVTENRYLREQLSTSQDEQGRLQRACAKYKSLLEARKKKGILRLGTPDSAALIVTKRQVAEMLRSGDSGQTPDTPATLSDLRSLCAALLEQLQDKCTALTHQRKANRLLAEQCSALRQQADRHGLSVQPSADLMAGYSATHIDRESEQLLVAPEEPVPDGCGGDSADPQTAASPPASPLRAAPAPLTASPLRSAPAPLTNGAAPSPGRRRHQQRRPADPRAETSSEDSPSPRHRPAPRQEQEQEEEILSIQELDRYVRCLRRPGDVRPVQVISEPDGGRAVTSPTRTLPAQAPDSPSRGPARPPPDGACRPAVVSGPQPAVQVLRSPSRAPPESQPEGSLRRPDSAELPAELDLLYRQALHQLRAGDQAT